jgi:putative flavoprotein involved in K+ transport
VVNFDHAANGSIWLISAMIAARAVRSLEVRTEPQEAEMSRNGSTEHVETIVIGAGQAGLAVGYHLARRRQEFVILEGGERVGDSWRKRWDSLRLFTPARYDGLPGWRFPARGWSFPTKDEMGDYLEAYAARFDLPVRTGMTVESLSRDGGRFVLSAGGGRMEADRVVVASGAHRLGRVPSWASELDPGIVQVHSSEYLSPSQLTDGAVLVVGAGNSGAEIAKELSATHTTLLAGRNVGEIPVPHGGRRARLLLPVIRFVGHRVMTVRTPIGRKVGPKLAFGATPLIRVKSKHLADAGVERLPKVAGLTNGRPVLEDGRVLDVANVVWCTGFRQDFSWIDLPVLDESGFPVHERGVVHSQPGLYFVGLPFLYAVTSDVLPGVGRDAKRIVGHLARLRPDAHVLAEREPEAVSLVA